MTDIVTRLREAESLTRNGDMDRDDIGDLLDWCADEVERLRADRDKWKELGQHVCEFHYSIIPQHIHDLFDEYNKAVRGNHV